jgi:superfamily II DNA/RNA helicase
MENFQHLGLPESLMQALNAMQFITPTPIQAQTIPLALQGLDILGSAQTGTGKTGAFGIPLIAHLINNPNSHALVLTPTRELALQVLQALQLMLGKQSSIKGTLLIGGASMYTQLSQLRNRPRLIVGTPGRVNDHLNRRSLNLGQSDFIVLDETDRMLDMGFEIQIQEIIKYLPKKRQTLMFSATLAPNIMKTAQRYLINPQRIAVGATTSPLQIKQDMVRISSESEKYPVLLQRLSTETGSCIIFVKTKRGTESLASKLYDDGHGVDVIHGDLKQRNRDQVIRAFRNGNIRILVATDVAARGLDIPHIECVINYDLPQCPEDYTHRIGRTGRAGASGTALSLVTAQDSSKWRLIHNHLNPDNPIKHTPAATARKNPHARKRWHSSRHS